MHVIAKSARLLAAVAALFGWLVADCSTALSQSPNIANQLRSLKETAVRQLRQYAQIIKSVRGPDHPDYIDALIKLGQALAEINADGEAERTLSEALSRSERLYGLHDQRLLVVLKPLGGVHVRQGAYDQALQLAKRALQIARNAYPPGHKEIGVSLNNVGLIETALGRFSSAEQRLKAAVAIVEQRPGEPPPLFALELDNLAEVYRLTGRFAAALALKKRAVGLIMRSPLPAHRLAGITVLSNLATLYRDMGDFEAAEARQRQALAIAERYLGANARKTAQMQVALGTLYWHFGRLDEAAVLFKRALATFERVLGSNHARVAVALNNLAQVHQARKEFAAAEPLMRRALVIAERSLGAAHHEVAVYLSNLGLLFDEMGQTDEAEPFITRAIAATERAFGADHPALVGPMINLADLFKARGDTGAAKSLYERAVAIAEAAVGPEHPLTVRSWSKLARLHVSVGDWQSALALSTRSSNAAIDRVRRLRSSPRFSGTELDRTGLFDTKRLLNDDIMIAFRMASSDPGLRAKLRTASFIKAQWAQATSAATALSQMAARLGAGDDDLARLVRSRQDYVAQWQAADRALAAALLQPPGKRSAALERQHRDTRQKAAARIASLERDLARRYPSYARLAHPVPLSVQEVQSLLREGEALVLFHDVPKTDELAAATIIWAITRTQARWTEVSIGGADLEREVDALRCGLDAAAWYDQGATRCASVLGMSTALDPGLASGSLPFPLSRAHQLYRRLFSGIADLVAGRQLLVVASGPLTHLPLQVLVARPPKADNFEAVHWLMRDHAITVLPAVPSLRALRRLARASKGTKAMFGIGNPLLEGDQTDPTFGPHNKRRARLAGQKQRCETSLIQRIAALVGLRRSIAPVSMHDGLADQKHIRLQTPLPETADELCAVAQALGAAPSDILLGAGATESAIRRLSANGRLKQYRILHFATHGALAGELTGTREPGLILTPPTTASAQDDGYLSASEIAELRLDADWIILSACNTASGTNRGAGAEALSGLARSFFYAGGRTLLVSHWEVNSDAAVKLVTTAIKAISRDNSVGRAEALRRAMLAIFKNGRASEKHPSYWAPFVVVGNAT